MATLLVRAALVLSCMAACLAQATAELSAHNLPIFFFHGITASAASGDVLKANLSTDARPFVALTFCQNLCSIGELNNQTESAIAQVRSIVASDKRFDNGYVFIGHSQGGALARAVIENMDDHKVHTFISLAGAVNGIFYGPQASDFVPGQVYLRSFAPVLLDKSLFNYSAYTDADIKTGKLQVALAKLQMEHPELQQVNAGYELSRSPVQTPWISYSPFFPVINNLRPATDKTVAADQARRKANFLKLKTAHFFASPFDETISPWQSSHLAQYNTVSSLEELEANFSKLTIVPMTQTIEYTQDLYGLKTLDTRGGLFLHTVENVSHSCWVKDSTSPRDGKVCSFLPVYEKNVYPILAPVSTPSTPEPTRQHC